MKQGFSLIELLVVVAIIGVLAGIGGFSYVSYVDSTRVSVSEQHASMLDRMLKTEAVAVAVGSGSGSGCVSGDTVANCADILLGTANLENPFSDFGQPVLTNVPDCAVRGDMLIDASVESLQIQELRESYQVVTACTSDELPTP